MTPTDVIGGATLLVTGANRGLGKALVEEALQRGASRVYAASRHPGSTGHASPRVTPITLDVTDPVEVLAASGDIPKLDILVNNAGVGAMGVDLSDQALRDHLEVNLFGTARVTAAFTNQILASRGRIVNISSVAAIAALPVMASYSVSKAAALSLTQAQRALFAGRGVRVHAVLAGPIDTEMSRGIPLAKAAPADVARAILDGVAADKDEIFPDALSAQLDDGWTQGIAKSLEAQNATYVQAAAA